MTYKPNGWQLATLDDVAIWASGGTPSRAVSSFYTGKIPWFKTGELVNRVLFKSEEQISEAAVSASSAKIFPVGAVALAMYGATIGRTSILGIAAATNQACAVGIPDAVSSDFLHYFLTSQTQAFIDAGKGGAQPNISQGIVKNWPLLVPPAAEQTRIVAKLEELLSSLDAGVAELKAAQKKLVQYRQSLLKAAVEGTLTKASRDSVPASETGSALLARILKERRARWEAKQLLKFAAAGKAPPKDWEKKYPEPAKPDTTGLAELPKGWVWASLDCLISDGPQNGIYLPARLYGKGTSILRIDDYQIGWHRARENLNLVNADYAAIATYGLCLGDLVINRVNSMTHLGKCLRIKKELVGALFESNMMRLHFDERVSDKFVELYLGSHIGRTRLIKDAKWAVNQASINQEDVKRTPIPFPALEEQVQISSVLASQLNALNAQLDAIDHSLKQSAAQRKNILQAAFAGRLVAQDPSDEPAGVLLARIAKERVSLSPQKLRGKA